MKKEILIKIGLVIYIFALNFKVQAVTECTQDEMNRLKELANNVEFTYEYRIDETNPGEGDYWVKIPMYTIKAINLHDDLEVKTISDFPVEFTKTTPQYDNFMNGEIVRIQFIAYTPNLCSGQTVLTKTIKLPYFNLYSLRDECKDNPDFKYCSEYGNYNITDEEFQSELEKYNTKGIDKVKEKATNFLKEYWVYLASGLGIIILITIITIIIKKHRRDYGDL